MGGCCGKRRENERRSKGEINRLLPAELLEKVFRLLSTKDLMNAVQVKIINFFKHYRHHHVKRINRANGQHDHNCVQVCRWWKEIGEAPVLWSWLRLPTVNQKNIDVIQELLEQSKRLQGIETLVARAVSEELLLAVAQHKSLRRLDFAHADLSSVESIVLARAICKMEEVDLGRSQFSPEQANIIFQHLSKNNNLHCLNLFNTNLFAVRPQQLAEAVTQVHEVTLWSCRLTPKHSEAIFRAMTSSCKLRKLDLSYNNLSTVNPNVLAAAINLLKNADLGCTCLTGEQASTILSYQIISPSLQVDAILCQTLASTSLESLWISGVKGEVDREAVARAARIVPELRIL